MINHIIFRLINIKLYQIFFQKYCMYEYFIYLLVVKKPI